ncbi:MAG: hypothetical protein RLZZ522_1098 [Verrucomicrobiota bacterium]
MNTKLDETALALWLDDELHGAELVAFEASLDGELLARREAVRAWRRTIGAALPATEEPPYPDFFNSRIGQALRHTSPLAARVRTAAWRQWWLPAAAVAGMALTFWLGTMTGEPVREVAQVPPLPEPLPAMVLAPAVYTPQRGVAAEWFSSADAAATVIVLEGLDALPDTLELSDSAWVDGSEKATAAVENASDRRALQ